MSVPRPITIVGGGLAGLTLGIGMRHEGIPATVIEASHYPRHRVCGEFISGRGVEVLEGLGLRKELARAGAIEARKAAFFSGRAGSPVRELETPALCISRFALDELLAKEFQRLGGDLWLDKRWRKEFGQSVVRATGRRPQAVEKGWRWFGVKAHARGVELSADLEMHTSRGGYVGLCRLKGGQVNVCGLFRRRPAAFGPVEETLALLGGAPGSILSQRLASGEFDADSICAVAGLSFGRHEAAAHNECCIGDALGMMPPVTGNGMSMAFESASLGIAPLTAYSRGQIPWSQAQQSLARACDERFGRRLAWAGFLQWLMFAAGLGGPLVGLALRSDWLWRILFARTR